MRQRIRADEGRLGELAIGFTEGGGASLFYEGRKIGGTPIEDEIAAACDVVFDDEVEHSGHGAAVDSQFGFWCRDFKYFAVARQVARHGILSKHSENI